MASNYKLTYGVDLVFCIDTTMSMKPILGIVKNNALNFYNDFQRVMEAKNKHVHQLRVRIVAFRDYYYDEIPMQISDFFNLPEESEQFELCVNSLDAEGGGDDPEDGLEALAYAMKSKWSSEHMKRRHVIVVWSDDATHDLGFGKSSPNYPNGMPKDFSELTQWWGNKRCPGVMDEAAKRLLLFTPSKDSWKKICKTWNNVIQYESDAGCGLSEFDYEQILNAISNTI